MKIKAFLFTIIAMFMQSNDLQAQIISKTDKILIVYYSRSGNTKEIANYIHNIIGGDIFEIQTVDSYPDEYKQTTEQAKKEIAEGFKPALKSKIDNIKDYDVVFVGSPCWWSTIAPPVNSFLAEYDLSGKTIIPFMTHGGSGLGRSVADIKSILPNSKVVDGEAFWGRNVSNARNSTAKWLKKLQKQ